MTSYVPGNRPKADLALLGVIVPTATRRVLDEHETPENAVYSVASRFPDPVPLDVRVDATGLVEEAALRAKHERRAER